MSKPTPTRTPLSSHHLPFQQPAALKIWFMYHKGVSRETPMVLPETQECLSKSGNISCAEGVMPHQPVSTQRFGERSNCYHYSMISDFIGPSNWEHSKDMFFEKQQFL
jgi:hypothetical protein